MDYDPENTFLGGKQCFFIVSGKETLHQPS